MFYHDCYFPGLCSQEEERLVRDLFRGYNKLIRPVQNMTQKVEVAFGLAFIQLINVVRIVDTYNAGTHVTLGVIFIYLKYGLY
jgi:Neurotransmitter-gated ion-channel ligand binding domain